MPYKFRPNISPKDQDKVLDYLTSLEGMLKQLASEVAEIKEYLVER